MQIVLQSCRSTPVEVLHTVLLGTAKYMVRDFMDKRSSTEKKGILARVSAFPYCGFSVRVNGNICYHFKAFMQMALFIVTPYVSETEKRCWILLSKVCDKCKLFALIFINTGISDSILFSGINYNKRSIPTDML